MGKEKAGFLTPKAISNRIKAKGLQKLRWYCQMCQKQCRDENGFKCHTMSESHQRQLLLVAENPHRYVDDFSGEFAETFLHLLKRRFGTKRVLANQVYQEYITDRHHTHMNSTKWLTLTGFVKWLGKTGKCVVDETEKGWFITYIDRDPETLRRQEEVKKKKKMDRDDEERLAAFIQKQIKRASAADKDEEATEDGDTAAEPVGLQRGDEEEKVVFSLGANKVEQPTTSRLVPVDNPFKVPLSVPAVAPSTASKDGTKPKDVVKRKSALDEIMEMEEKKKKKYISPRDSRPSERTAASSSKGPRKDYWLYPDIIVKVVTKKLGDKYYKKKAVIKDVVDKYGAVIKMTDSGDKLKVDQEHLETVIPALGKDVLVVNGEHRNKVATLLELDQDKFSCTVKIRTGPNKGLVVDNVQYEDISKLHVDS